MEKPKKYEDRLMEAFTFDEDDLAANQAGTLTQRQAAHLNRERRSLALGGTSILFLGFIVMMVMLGAVNVATLVPPVATVLLGMGALFVGLSAFLWMRSQRIITDIRANRVAEVEGRVDLSVRAAQNAASYYLRVGDMRFTVKQKAFLAFKNGDPYRIYYMPRSKRIVSVEWLRENDDNLLEAPAEVEREELEIDTAEHTESSGKVSRSKQ